MERHPPVQNPAVQAFIWQTLVAHLRAELPGEQSVKLLAVSVSCLCVNRGPRLCCCYCCICGFLWDVRCSLMSVSCCSARKREGERGDESLPITAWRFLPLPAQLHMHIFPCALILYCLKMQTCMQKNRCTGIHKQCTQSERKCFSDPALRDKAALQFRNMQPAC